MRVLESTMNIPSDLVFYHVDVLEGIGHVLRKSSGEALQPDGDLDFLLELLDVVRNGAEAITHALRHPNLCLDFLVNRKDVIEI